MINKYEQEIQELKKKLSENEEYFNNEEKNRIKKDNHIKRYEQEIQELEKQLNDNKKTEEEKIYDNIPYLETEEEAVENKTRTFAPKDNVKKNMILILMILILNILIWIIKKKIREKKCL